MQQHWECEWVFVSSCSPGSPFAHSLNSRRCDRRNTHRESNYRRYNGPRAYRRVQPNRIDYVDASIADNGWPEPHSYCGRPTPHCPHYGCHLKLAPLSTPSSPPGHTAAVCIAAPTAESTESWWVSLMRQSTNARPLNCHRLTGHCPPHPTSVVNVKWSIERK